MFARALHGGGHGGELVAPIDLPRDACRLATGFEITKEILHMGLAGYRVAASKPGRRAGIQRGDFARPAFFFGYPPQAPPDHSPKAPPRACSGKTSLDETPEFP
ncbi:hypothetical protein ATH84_101633 [Paracoccus versutus]|uniref:Uncharacterized protein n=1 Tax=Paracoccus versutus TaxID=34007 RepID=A0AAQ0HH50_PARVE|nr:hypothetical protein [Paracoccus versutus]REG46173.1 hypothetical protein ATH84_101633 [Paracoccus versutus]